MSNRRLDTSVFSDGPEPGLSVGKEARPWPRFWARQFDLALWTFLIGLPFALVARASGLDVTGPALWWLIALFFALTPLALLIDALINAGGGRSPGKILAGVSLEARSGYRLSVAGLIRRNAVLFVFGLGLGIPLLNLAGYIFGYNRVSSGVPTPWDRRAHTRVIDQECSPYRTVLAATLFFAVAAVDRAVWAF